MYIDLISKQAYHNWHLLIPEEMMDKYNIPKNEMVTVINGEDFKPEYFGFRRKVPIEKQYLFYYFEHPVKH